MVIHFHKLNENLDWDNLQTLLSEVVKLVLFYFRIKDDLGRSGKVLGVNSPSKTNNTPSAQENLPPSPTKMDKSIFKVHLPEGGFNVVKFSDAIDVKVSEQVRK